MTIKLYSEKLNKYYAEDEKEKLEADEKAFDEAKAAEEEKKATRAVRAKEVEDAYLEVAEAKKKADALRSKFVDDYGAFYMRFRRPITGSDVRSLFFDPWF